MIFSTEVFVMIINLIGLPLFAGVIRSARLPGSRFFVLAYFSLMLSNIFTVVEELRLSYWFNFLEHASVTMSSIFFFFAIRALIIDRTPHEAKGLQG